MKRKLLLTAVALLCTVGTWAYRGVEPAAGRTYFLYNVGANAYFVGTSLAYSTDGNIANATPVTVETSGSNFKLAYSYNGTTYRIYQHKGDSDEDNTTGVDFWFTPDGNGYKLQSKNPSEENTRDMNSGVNFPKDKDSNKGNVTWQFISCEAACAEVAEASYVQPAKGWQRVTSVSALQTNPEDYFFAIFSTNATGSMVRTNASNGQGYYVSACSPLSSAEYLFGIENYSYSENDYFVMKAQNTNAYYYPLYEHAYDLFAPSDGKTTADDACRLTFSYSNDSWNIKTWAVWGGSYWGLWDYDHGYQNGEKMAGNKGDSEKGSFLIYRIAKKNLVMTDLIDNPDMETADSGSGYGEHVKSWNNTGNVVNYRRLANSGVNNPDGAFTNTYCFENWTNASDGLTGQMSQTISSLPNGVYKLQLAALVRSVNGQFIYGKSNGKVYKTDLSGDGEKAYDYTVYVLVEDNQLEIGLDMNNAGADWAAIDNARLTYLISSLPASLTGASGKMNNTVAAAQTTAIAAYNAVYGQTPSNYAAAIEAIANAEASIAAYAKAATYLSSVEAVLATTNFYTPAAYASVYGTYKTAYDAGTLDDAIADGLSYKVANYSGTERYDKNTANDLLIPGWTIDGNDAITTNSGFYINTWSTEDNSNGFANPFYEYWVADNSVLGAKKIVGTLSGLTANKYYKVTAKVRVRETDSSTKVANSITMQVGSGDKVDVTAGTQISTTPRYVGQFSAIGQADKSGNLALTFDVASGSNISWLSFRDVNYSDPTPEAKAVLLSTINDANTLYNSGANVGSGVFQIPTAAGTTFSNAIATARGVYDNASSTYEEVLSANSTLQTAITTYEGVTLNAPTGGTRYKLTLAGRGTLTYQTASTEGGYGMPFKAAGDYMAQTFTFTQVSGNTYTMSFEDLEGNTRYICTRAQYGEGGTGTYGIRSFVAGEDGKTALPITIKATTTANVFNMLNTECDNKKLGSNGGDFYTDDTYTSWSIAEASQASVAINLTAGKYATRIFPFTPGTIDGIKFYSCENVEGERAQIDEVVTPEANKPYILKATKDVETELSGWGTAVADSYTQGWLTGVYTATTIAASVEPTAENDGAYRYVLQTQDAVQAFYKVNAEFTATAYRAYLTVPVDKTGAGVKALFLDFGDATGINTVQGLGFKVQDSKIFNLAGQKMSKLQKGVNIVNGKKVLVK